VYYFLPLGGQKYFHKRPIGSFRGSIDLSLINSKMLRIKGCLLDGRILSIDGLWVKLLFMWISIFSRPHVVEIAWLSTTWGLLQMKTHIKRSVTHKPSLILTKFDLLGDYLSLWAFLYLLMKGLRSLKMGLWAFCENIFDCLFQIQS